MSRDAERKRTLLVEWWGELLSCYSVRILDRGEALDKRVVVDRLEGRTDGCPAEQSIYVLMAETESGFVPVYVGKADSPLTRWGQHLDGWLAGVGSYARWREALLDEVGRAREALGLLIVPATHITRPPIPGFPITVGSVEYQLVSLAQDAFPGRLLNREGVRR